MLQESQDHFEAAGAETFDDLASRGIDVLSDTLALDASTGAFRCAGFTVILYRRQRVRAASDFDLGKPFHLTRCESLRALIGRTPPMTHTITSRRDGKVSMLIEGADQMIDYPVSLHPCKLCLTEVDQDGYRSATSAGRAAIRENFSVSAYLDACDRRSRDAHAMPMTLKAKNAAYPESWAQTSRLVRERANWMCQQCGVSCVTEKALLHTHHINGNKSDLRDENLIQLCLTCHRSVPGHATMFVSPENIAKLEVLRRYQRIAR